MLAVHNINLVFARGQVLREKKKTNNIAIGNTKEAKPNNPPIKIK